VAVLNPFSEDIKMGEQSITLLAREGQGEYLLRISNDERDASLHNFFFASDH
jgi:hypothetical protein